MSATTSISGRVKRIKYSGKGYWSIFEIETAGGQVVVAKGTLAAVYEGDVITLVGREETDAKWGKQFLVERVEREERNGVEVVLEMLPDVGPARAKLLREAFGESDVFRVIEEDPARLKAIPGLTDERIAAIREVCIQRKAERELLLWCGTNNVSAYHAGNIWKKFGARSLAVLRETPYEVVKADGIGFLTADRIARRAGADPNGVDRAKAAILYVLAEAEAADGSTVVEASMVLAASRGAERGPGGRHTACQLSPPLADDVVYQAIGLLRSEREIYMGGGDPPLIQRGLTRAAEKSLAERLVAFARRPSTAPPPRPRWYGGGSAPNPELDDPMETPWTF